MIQKINLCNLFVTYKLIRRCKPPQVTVYCPRGLSGNVENKKDLENTLSQPIN
jgi:hypothetical protein